MFEELSGQYFIEYSSVLVFILVFKDWINDAWTTLKHEL